MDADSITQKSLCFILLGGPGAGKGTLAQFLSSHYDIPSISTGDMLRAIIASNTELGAQIENTVATGGLVVDDIVISLIKERLTHQDCKRGYILDGFPRTLVQAQMLKQAGIKVDYVIDLIVPESEIVARLSNRWIHQASGRIYNLKTNPPLRLGVDNVTGEPLVQREDDKSEVIRQRFQGYCQKTQPIAAYYKSLSYDTKDLQYIALDGMDREYVQQQVVSHVDAR